MRNKAPNNIKQAHINYTTIYDTANNSIHIYRSVHPLATKDIDIKICVFLKYSLSFHAHCQRHHISVDLRIVRSKADPIPQALPSRSPKQTIESPGLAQPSKSCALQLAVPGQNSTKSQAAKSSTGRQHVLQKRASLKARHANRKAMRELNYA